MSQHVFATDGSLATVFDNTDGPLRLRQLYGLPLCDPGKPSGTARPPQDPSFTLVTSLGALADSTVEYRGTCTVDHGFEYTRSVGQGALALVSTWVFCPTTGILTRRDRLSNTGAADVTVYRALSTWTFAPARYRYYRQTASWCNENQGAWQQAPSDALLLQSHKGRTTQKASPYLAVQDVRTGNGATFHLVPTGNWVMKVSALPAPGSPETCFTLDMGLADSDLHRVLHPGATLDLPVIHVQPMTRGDPGIPSAELHNFLLEGPLCPRHSSPPVVYNTWFDRFDTLDVARLEQQLEAARSVGCEVFTVDAGWFGQEGGWWNNVGNWQERTDAAFHGRMAAFANKVRDTGLGFGLWMEPERLAPSAPVLREHPEWFLVTKGSFARPDLSNPSAYAWVKGEMVRLLDAYGLVWMKIDFNGELGTDPSGTELEDYYTAWYRLLDELRVQYPQVFFEGCSGGGGRLELASIRHYDGHFLSDNADPVQVIRIYMALLLRMPPGVITKWCVVRPASATDAPLVVETPEGGKWGTPRQHPIDFAVLAHLPGILGFSGDLAGLAPEARQRIAHHIAFYKEWRAFMTTARARLLTPPAPANDTGGWAALELSHPLRSKRLVFAWRLDDDASDRAFVLAGLDPQVSYRLSRRDSTSGSPREVTGHVLTTTGLAITIPERFGGAVYEVRAQSRVPRRPCVRTSSSGGTGR